MAVISIGPIGNTALRAIESLGDDAGRVALYDLRFVKPLDEVLLREIGQKYRQIVTVEDGVLKGGMGSAVLEFMSDNNLSPKITRLGIPDVFVEHGMPFELYEMLGLDSKGIAETLTNILKNIQ